MRDLFRDTFLGFVRVHLLHHAAREPIFGTEMIGELRRHGYALSPGTLYPMLHALETEGHLRSEARVIDGKVRRYYRSTPVGRRALERLKVKIRELVDEVLEHQAPAERPARAGTSTGTAAIAKAKSGKAKSVKAKTGAAAAGSSTRGAATRRPAQGRASTRRDSANRASANRAATSARPTRRDSPAGTASTRTVKATTRRSRGTA